jgi:RNA polymerase sigma-70 factor (ECF subfamily)
VCFVFTRRKSLYRVEVDETLNAWFAREILAHEAALVRYLTRAWPRRDEIHDLRQEAYIRVYEAARRRRPHAPKSFLFTTARHLMADRLRRARIVSIEAVGDLDDTIVPVEEISPERRLHARQELVRLARAFSVLPPRCREVVWLRRVDELSQKEIASRLQISEKTVESHILNGMRLLADALLRQEVRACKDDVSGILDSESEHG